MTFFVTQRPSESSIATLYTREESSRIRWPNLTETLAERFAFFTLASEANIPRSLRAAILHVMFSRLSSLLLIASLCYR